jgi:hypothetical protein
LLDSAAVFFLVAKRRKFATQNKTWLGIHIFYYFCNYMWKEDLAPICLGQLFHQPSMRWTIFSQTCGWTKLIYLLRWCPHDAKLHQQTEQKQHGDQQLLVVHFTSENWKWINKDTVNQHPPINHEGMDGKWLGNSFLLRFSSLAKHGGQLSSFYTLLKGCFFNFVI